MNDRTTLVNGSPVPDDRSHEQLRPDGQQQTYVVLSAEERAKGFVRPVRRTYVHVGVRPKYPLVDLTAEQAERADGLGYIKYEKYPEGHGALGRYWTKAQLNSGCGQPTSMGIALAETYAREPGFYGGTFCSHCGVHFPVGAAGEFVWQYTTIRVGT